ncbi:extracellular solute-binding protein [Streptomyces adustus]|uniref:Extracellular solute-binding protein n=1 Tax=Streptomyces adustus TaxID=1609272 RepID=A0A5N8V4P2_9ACTN|nr:extracellular solute-binding protein [Streptomyces adustus]MPY29846.1 extracellular solute-binding protein [Streptomyces adustus]
MRASRPAAATLAVLGLAAFTAACTSDTAGSGGGDTLRVAANSTDREPMDAVVAAFRKANPDIKVSVTYADTDQLQSTLRTQLSSGTAPDVFTVWPGNGNPGALQVLQKGGYLADLSGYSFASKISDGDKSVTQVDGKTYIVPVTFNGIGAIYNKATLTEIGGTEPKTWDDVLALCTKAKDHGKVLLALGNQTNWVTQLVDYSLAATTVYAQNPDFDAELSAGKATFAGSAWKQTMQKYLDLDKAGCFSKNPNGTSYETSISDVAQGKAVGVVQVTTSIPQVQKEAGADAELGMFALPSTNNADETRIPAAVSAAYGLNAAGKHAAEGKKFVEFLASSEGQKIYAEKGSTLPVLPNDSFKADPALTGLIDMQKNGKTVPFMDQRWPNPEVQATHFTAVQKLFSGSESVDEALKSMDDAAKKS